jgi:serine/threonine-protein kinase
MTVEGTLLAGRYEVGELLGRGGMAEVYLATDRVLQRPVAVKILGSWLADDGTFVERFRREALAAARLSHPDLVAVYDTGSDSGLHFIVMEHVPGETLADALGREGRLPAGRAKLMDLGIARTLDGESLTRTTSILGSPNYLSPEQARGERVDARSDVYSLGCVLYEMLSGRPPFDADSAVAVAYKHVHEDPAPPSALEPAVPAGLDAVTLRAMAKEPRDRFQTAEDMAAALDDPTLPIVPVTTAPLPATERTAPMPRVEPTAGLPRRTDRPRRRNLVPLLLALGVLAILGGLAVALLGGPQPVAGGPTASRSESPSPTGTPSGTSSPSSTPTTEPAGPVEAAITSLAAIVEDGVAGGRISEKAARDIDKHVEDALKKFDDGDTEEAIKKLDELESKIDDFVDHEEIAHSEEQRLVRALQDLEGAIFLADPPGDEDD